jgi:serine/threonine protein kinase
MHKLMGMEVAVKILKPHLHADEKARKQFIKEAKSVTLIRSKHVVQTFDVDEDEKYGLFIVMELTKGMNLKELASSLRSEEQDLSLELIIDLAVQVCDALQEAHDNGIVHRDLKPANIMVERAKDGSFVAKVMDFGIAQVARPSETGFTLTETSMGPSWAGTPAYMSPEQCKGLPAVPQSDLYSLGIILYELLLGDVPFKEPTVEALMIAHATKPLPVEGLRARRQIPMTLERMLVRLLSKSPDERPVSAKQVALELATIREEIGGKVKQKEETKGKKTVFVAASIIVALVALGIFAMFTIGKKEQPNPEAKMDLVSPMTTTKDAKIIEDAGGKTASLAGISTDTPKTQAETSKPSVAMPGLDKAKPAPGSIRPKPVEEAKTSQESLEKEVAKPSEQKEARPTERKEEMDTAKVQPQPEPARTQKEATGEKKEATRIEPPKERQSEIKAQRQVETTAQTKPTDGLQKVRDEAKKAQNELDQIK